MKPQRNTAKLIWLVIIVLLLVVFDLSVGTIHVPIPDMWRILISNVQGEPLWGIIIMEIRLPKMLTAVLAGSALPVAGLFMQTYFRNPVAGPDILGVSAGSSLCVAFVMLSGLSISAATFGGTIPIILAAITGAAAVLLVILLVSTRIRDTMTLLIFGIMFGMAISAIVGVLQYYSERGALKLFMLWTFGSLNGVTLDQFRWFAPVILICLTGAMFLSGKLNLLLLGENYAKSSGLNVRQTRNVIIILTAVITGIITAFCGPIAFIGIAVPHLARMIFKTNDHRMLLPASMLLGACILLICDMLTQIPGEAGILPLNAITAFMGAPFVIFIIWRQQHVSNQF